MAKKDKKNKKSATPFSSRISSDGDFMLLVKNTDMGKAIDTLASIKLSRRQRDSILNAIESHERSANSPQEQYSH